MAFEPMLWTDDFVADYEPQADVWMTDSLQDVDLSTLIALVDDERSLSLGTYLENYDPGDATDFSEVLALPPPPPPPITRDPLPPTPTPPPPTFVLFLPPPSTKPVGESLTRGGHLSQLQVSARELLEALQLILSDEQKGQLAPYTDPVAWHGNRIKEATAESNRQYHKNRTEK